MRTTKLYHAQLPAGAVRAGAWFISNGKSGHSILRMVHYPARKSIQRYPRRLYSHFTNAQEVEALTYRLNGRNIEAEKACRRLLTRNSAVPLHVLEDFRSRLLLEVTNEKDARYRYQLFIKHALRYFVEEEKNEDPAQWPTSQAAWGQYLLKTFSSADSIRRVVQITNRFLMVYKEHYQNEVNIADLRPISKARLKSLGPSGQDRSTSFISDESWSIIDKNLPDDIGPFVRLAYHYGLRRSEALAIEIHDVRKGYLSIERVLKGVGPVYGPLKSRVMRQTPHWFCSPERAYSFSKGILDRPHPDTLGDKFKALMKSLELKAQFHDLRRTFITKALSIHPSTSVMLAVGHRNLSTTQRYILDSRRMDSMPFEPMGEGRPTPRA